MSEEEKPFEIDDSYEMPFGKYKGEYLGDVPASYLIWFYEQATAHRTQPLLYAYIKKNLKHLQTEAANRSVMPYCEEEDSWGDR